MKSAVQLARRFGANVTGVCSTANLGLVKSIGSYRKDGGRLLHVLRTMPEMLRTSSRARRRRPA